MALNDIYDQNRNPDNVDLIELLEEIKKDMEDFRLPPLKEVVIDTTFNPLLKEYYVIKEKYLEAQKTNPESFTREMLENTILELIRSQPDYQKYVKYINLKETEVSQSTERNQEKLDEEENEL